MSKIPHDADAEQAVIGYMVLHPERDEAQRALTAADFHHPVAAAVFAGYDPSATIEALGDLEGVDGRWVAEAIAHSAMPSTIGKYVARVRDLADRRAIIAAAHEAALAARDLGTPTAAASDRLTAALDELAPRGATPATNAEDFLAEHDDPHDWLIPGLIERGDRMLVTAAEGGGKSTLLRQIAVGVACGIHPLWPSRQIPTGRVLLVDLENSERQTRRKLRPLRTAANTRLDNLSLVVRSSGLDLMRRGDQQWLLSLVADAHPDLLVIGPLYRMFAGTERGDVGGENQARQVTAVLDRCRAMTGCALLMETHAPHGSSMSSHRDLRPFGSSVWLRWPEFGIGIAEDPENPSESNVVHWRGPRDERDWPQKLTRGGAFPWAGYYPQGIKEW